MPGCRNVVVNASTGLLFASRSAAPLAAAIARNARMRPGERDEVGRCLRARDVAEFDVGLVLAAKRRQIEAFDARRGANPSR